jgi:hypothetical protein
MESDLLAFESAIRTGDTRTVDRKISSMATAYRTERLISRRLDKPAVRSRVLPDTVTMTHRILPHPASIHQHYSGRRSPGDRRGPDALVVERAAAIAGG